MMEENTMFIGETPAVAIIMRSKDEKPYVDTVLERLREQTYTNYVLYNIDSGSTDGTLETVKRSNPDPGKVYEIPAESYVPGIVLNDMVARTAEPIVVLLNADAIPQSNDWLEKLLRPILSGEVDATMSRQIARPAARFIDRYDYDRAYEAVAMTKADGFFSAVACAFKRELWEETRFYTEGYAEDLAWSKTCQDKGHRFTLVMDSVVEHSHNFTLKGLYTKRYRHGVAYVYIYDARSHFFRQLYRCVRELARDFLYAVRKGRVDTVPYNIAYRVVIHWAYYRGMCDGLRKFGKGTGQP
jgi:rhamnosyltransferase